ncbi:unnamed protein product [Thlaspi arvense]|uniref:Kinesin light chain n=1 Tax=Thlaspi arvense TaxID=13288 RepID=A0AAU9T5T1_THLAR|nr:unnamed protein product [Thlaspi arvense]
MSPFRTLTTLLRVTHRPSRSFSSSQAPISSAFANSISGKPRISYQNNSGGHTRNLRHLDPRLWMIFSGQAAILGFCGNVVLAENETKPVDDTGLERIEDGSVVSNIHTSKWRVFTDSGRDHFFQGKLKPAERLFSSAIQEAKEGFGERDPHVASACNNLAELYRVKKEFDKAEPLYREAVSILEESYGPEDVRVGATLHNLGQLYLVQRKLEEARVCYEVITIANLPVSLYYICKEKKQMRKLLFWILLKYLRHEGGQGESMTYIRRLKYLSQIYVRSNRLAEAESIHRKILHLMELSKGWNSMEAVTAAEALALTLQLSGKLREALELFEKCLDTQKTLLPEGHIQIGGNFLHIAKTLMLQATQLRRTDKSEALSKLEKAKNYLEDSSRIAKDVLLKLKNRKSKEQKHGKSNGTLRNYEHAALVILLQSLESLAVLEMSKNEIQEPKFGCGGTQLQDSPEVKSEYLSCLKHLSALLANKETTLNSKASPVSLLELKEEVKRIEIDLLSHKKG